MFTTIKSLDAEQQRQLVRLLDARVDLGATPDEEVFVELVAVLRDVLQVPPNRDVPEYLRRRLVEVVVIHFELADSVDHHTDIEVAKLIADFAFEAASQLAIDDERRAEFELFLRTKDKRERTRWLVESQRFASLVTDGTFDEAAVRRRARELNDGSEAHIGTAANVLRDLSTGSTGQGAASAAASGASAAAAATAFAAGASAALPLGAVVGAMFLAGRRRRNLVRGPEPDADKTRAKRARSSRLVQGVVGLCVFVVVGTDPTAK